MVSLNSDKNEDVNKTFNKSTDEQQQIETSKSSYVDVNNFTDYKVIGELFNEFIILEKGDNMLLLDFHAGHERLNYDKFTKHNLNGFLYRKKIFKVLIKCNGHIKNKGVYMLHTLLALCGGIRLHGICRFYILLCTRCVLNSYNF